MFSTFVYGIEPESFDSPELKTRIHYHSMIMSILNPAHPFNLFPSLWTLPLPLKKRLINCLEVIRKEYSREEITHDPHIYQILLP